MTPFTVGRRRSADRHPPPGRRRPLPGCPRPHALRPQAAPRRAARLGPPRVRRTWSRTYGGGTRRLELAPVRERDRRRSGDRPLDPPTAMERRAVWSPSAPLMPLTAASRSRSTRPRTPGPTPSLPPCPRWALPRRPANPPAWNGCWPAPDGRPHGDRPDSDENALDKGLAADPGLLTHLPLTGLPERLGRSLPSWPGLWRRQRGRLLSGAEYAGMPLLVVGGHHDHFTGDTVDAVAPAGAVRRRGCCWDPGGTGLVAEPGPDADPAHRVSLGELYVRWARPALSLGTSLPGQRGVVGLGGSTLWMPADAEGEPRTQNVRLLYGFLLHGRSRTPRVVRGPGRFPRTVSPDRCLLVTPPLPRPLDVVGPAEVRLRATAHTPSADWAVRLVALTPEGPAQRLAVGVVRREEPPGSQARVHRRARPARAAAARGHPAAP
ncbi:hypothetical protein STENM223S_04053 [Streptomyces tendae]